MDQKNPSSSVEQNKQNISKDKEVSTPIKQANNSGNIDTNSIMNFIKEIFNKALNTFKNPKQMTPLIIAGLISWGIAMIPVLSLFFPPLLLISLPATLILTILYSFSMAGITLRSAKGEVPKTSDATKPLANCIDYIVSYIQIFIQFIIRLFQPPFIIPGFKYAIGSSLFVLENIENNTPNNQAIKKSQEITSGNLLNIFCLVLALAVINFVLGLIPFSIATIVTAPFSALCIAHTYLKLKK